MTITCSRQFIVLVTLSLFAATGLTAGSARNVSGPELTAAVSSKGEITSLTYGAGHKGHPVRASLRLAGCRVVSPVSTQRYGPKGVSFTRRWMYDRDSSACVVVERFYPVGTSIRWEAEIRGTGSPWSTAIETQFAFPDVRRKKVWAPWGDPKLGQIASMNSSQQKALGVSTADTAWKWSDPLVAIPFVTDTLWFGAPAYDNDNPRVGFIPFQGNLISIPLVTVLESDADEGLSIALSPEDQLLDLRIVMDEKGTLSFARLFHRISAATPVRFAVDLIRMNPTGAEGCDG